MPSPIGRLNEAVEFLRTFDADTSPRLIRTSWAVLLFASLVVLLITLLTVRYQKDFSQDYFAAKAFFEGSSIYSKRVVELGELFNGRGIENAHPPSLVLLLLPFAIFPYSLAYFIYSLFSVLIYTAALHLAGRLAGLSRVYQRLLISTSLLWPATLQSIHQGSVSFLIASFTILGWICIRRNRSITAASMLGIATALKFFPGILVFPFIFQRNWKACLAYAASFGSLILSSLLIFGWQDWDLFVRETAPHVSHEFLTHYANVSIWAYILPWFTKQPYLPPIYESSLLGNTLALAAAAVLLGLSIHAQITSEQRQDEWEYSYWLWALCSVLLAPVSWQYSLTFLPVPIALLLRKNVNHQQAYLFGATILTCICLTLADYNSYSLLLKRASSSPLIPSLGLYLSYILHTKIQSTGVLFLFCLLVARRGSKSRG